MARFLGKIYARINGETGIKKFLKYALTEVFLVVIGILIALALNDWNANRIERNDVKSYFPKLVAELDLKIKAEKEILDEVNVNIGQLTTLQYALVSKNNDSIKIKVEGLSNLEFTRKIEKNHPVYEEFVAKNYLTKIKQHHSAIQLKSLKQVLVAYNDYIQHSQKIHTSVILPLMMDHLYYAKINNINNDGNSSIENFLANPQLVNIVALRLKLLEEEKKISQGALAVFQIAKETFQKRID